MRKFYLINEQNAKYDLQNIQTEAFLASPSGLGYETNYTYIQMGSSYIEDSKTPVQSIVLGSVYFKGYEEYQIFINYVERSERLRLIYQPLDIPYYREVDFASISKTEIDPETGYLICPIKLNCKGLYYTEDDSRFIVQNIEGESRYSLRFPFKFNDYSIVGVDYTNYGHDEGSLLAEINGYIEDPTLELYVQGKLIYRIVFNITVQEGEKLLYSSRDGNNYVVLEDAEGNRTKATSSLSLESDNFFKIPKGGSFIKVTSDKASILGKVLFTIITPYKGV